MSMWIIYALLSAVTAALVAVFGKLGLKDMDPTLATTVRAIIMTGVLILVSLVMHKFNTASFSNIPGREWLFIGMAGLAGALSWLFYFIALKHGAASDVVAIDRLSIVFVVFLAALFLGESLTWTSMVGAFLVVAGAILISFT